jgi:D-alanyl-D-alanine carboxypeptidase (penicillin-binding protein 5/6)
VILARHAILIDAVTGRTLYQKNADVRTQVASTQKLLTALVVLEAGAMEREVEVRIEDTRVEPTKLGVRAGERYTRRELFQALLVKSMNDAAAVLARDTAGTQAAFVARMNSRALELGAVDSMFLNPHGLPAPQYSTARDMARIARAAYRTTDIRLAAATKYSVFVFASGRRKQLENTNELLGKVPYVNGLKTGYTIAAGRCLVASAYLGGRELILVQLGSRSSHIFKDAIRMFEWVGRGSVPPSADFH